MGTMHGADTHLLLNANPHWAERLGPLGLAPFYVLLAPTTFVVWEEGLQDSRRPSYRQ